MHLSEVEGLQSKEGSVPRRKDLVATIRRVRGVGILSKEWKRLPPFDWHPKQETFVATIKNESVGYVRITINSGVCYLDEIIVAKGSRRMAIGSSLIKFVEAHCKQLGCHKISLQTSEKHREALAFYHRMGFQKEAVHKNDLGHLTWLTLAKFI